MFKRLNIAFVILSALISGPAHAGAPGDRPLDSPLPHYGLADLYQIALEYAEKIKISQEDLYIAAQNRAKAFAELIPQLATFGTYTQFSEKKETIGGAVVQPNNAATWGVRLGQAYNLRGREFIALRAAEDTITKSKYDLNAVKEGYLFLVTAAFYDVLRTQKALEIARANVTRLEKHKAAVDTRLQLEEVTKTALFRVEAELSGARTEMITATNRLKLQQAVLKRLVGVTHDFDIEAPPHQPAGSLDLDLQSLKKEALDARAEIRALNIQDQIAADQVKISRSFYWPSIRVEGLYVDQHEDPEVALVSNDSLSVELSVEYPIFDAGRRKAQVREALAAKRQAALALADLSKDIAVEVEQAYLVVINQQSILASLDDQLTFARENYEAVSKQFKFGLSDSVDVMDANTLLVTAEIDLTDARLSLQLARIQLKRAQGTFLNQVMTMIQPQ
ncbi:MAG: TolC family protein [Desulfobacterales bacterium]|nr:MAG: TolC family protein [Desulfobacterales bacterium]